MFGDAIDNRGQMSLFGEGDNRIPHPKPPSIEIDPARVRAKLLVLLETARNADKMPWDARKAGMWRIVFPQMANWLPEAERDQLRLEFAREFERLQRAA
ncbi:hypothetical protein IP88_09455 [alpha proteobacterium AAP81b]|nr:hypothetical protein IP88_09455 [alpha proteobacterium AAP81b]